MQTTFDVLDGVKVVEFGDDLAASLCAYHLRLLGATVFLIEPRDGCWLRRVPKPRVPDADYSLLFALYGRGKRSVDLGSVCEAGNNVWRGVDILFEAGWQREQHPAAIREACEWDDRDGIIRVSFREADGTRMPELAMQASSGMMSYVGRMEEPPLRVGFEVITYAAAVLGVQAVLAALRVKRRCGPGQRIRIPLSRAAASLLNNNIVGSLSDEDTVFSRGWARRPITGLQASDGAVDFLFYGAGSEDGWALFCRRLGADHFVHDPRYGTYHARLDCSGELYEELRPWTTKLSRAQLLALLRECGAMAVPKYAVGEAASSSQALANGMVCAAGPAPQFALPASPWTVNQMRAFASGLPAIGEHTRQFTALGEEVMA